jgi:hypothetical protein
MSQDLYAEVKAVALMPAGSRSDSAEGEPVEVSNFEGRGFIALSSEAGSAGTLNGVVEHSADDVEYETLTDEAGEDVAIEQVGTGAASFQVIPVNFDRCRRFVRFNPTIDTGPFVYSVVLAGSVKYAPARYD